MGLRVDNLSDVANTQEVRTDTLIQGAAIAWADFGFNPTSSVPDSLNVSSFVDLGFTSAIVNLTNVAASSSNAGFLCSSQDSGTTLRAYQGAAEATSSPAFYTFVCGSNNSVANSWRRGHTILLGDLA